MFQIVRRGLVVLGLLTLFAATALAEPHHRGGFFIGLGLGGGSSNEEYVNGGSVSEPGGVGTFRIGGAVAPDVLLGLESTAFTRVEEFPDGTDARFTASVAAFAATWYPTSAGFFLRGGIGVARGEVELRNGGFAISGDETGLGFLLAIGNEWRLSKKFALGPQGEFAYLGIGGDVVDSISYGSLSLQGSWYW